jgi:hypothetical protein
MYDALRLSNPQAQTMFHKAFNDKWCRLTKVVCPNLESTTVFIWPTKIMRDKYTVDGVLPYISGFENESKDNTGWNFNFILSNGDRSGHSYWGEFEEGEEDEEEKGGDTIETSESEVADEDFSTEMMPEDAHLKIK